MGRGRRGVLIGKWSAFSFFLLFFFLPIILLVFRFSVANLWELIYRYRHVVFFNIYQAFFSALLATILGSMISYALARRRFPTIVKAFFGSFSKVAFVMPGISMAMGFLLLFGKDGFLNYILKFFGMELDILYTFPAVILGHAFYNTSVTVYITGSVWERLDGEILEAAEIDGSNDFQIFWNIEFPLLFPSFVSSFLLSFVYSFTSFAVVMTIGGPRYSTLEVLIYKYIFGYTKLQSALALAFVQLLIVFISSITASILASTKIPAGVPRVKNPGIFSYLMLFVPGFIIVLPVVLSFIGGFYCFGSFSLLPFNKLFKEGFYFVGLDFSGVVFQSILIGTISAVIAVSVSLTTSFFSSRGYKSFYFLPILPSAISTATLSFGTLLVAWILNVKSFFYVPVVHSLLAIPFVHMLFDSGWRSIPQYIEDCALLDGASTAVKIFKIYFPLLKSHIIRGFLLSFAISMSDLAGVLILSGGEIVTFSRAIHRLMSGRHILSARALNTIFMIVVLAVLAAGEFISVNYFKFSTKNMKNLR